MDAISIPLTGKSGFGLCALIDAADEPLTYGYRWSLGSGGYARGYRHECGQRSAIQLHVLLCGMVNIDHRDGDKLNCRRNNLRPSTRSQNNANRRGWSKSGYKGVREIFGKFTSRLQANGRTIHLGTFATPELAARAYDRAALEHFGEFARLNFPAEVA